MYSNEKTFHANFEANQLKFRGGANDLKPALCVFLRFVSQPGLGTGYRTVFSTRFLSVTRWMALVYTLVLSRFLLGLSIHIS